MNHVAACAGTVGNNAIFLANASMKSETWATAEPQSHDAMGESIEGLLDQIRRATSAAEIDCLLEQGENYEHASERTRKRWRRKARQRKEQLEK